MHQDPADCPGHAWASVGVTVVDGTVHQIWDCERCTAWTSEPLDEDHHVAWGDTSLSK